MGRVGMELLESRVDASGGDLRGRVSRGGIEGRGGGVR